MTEIVIDSSVIMAPWANVNAAVTKHEEQNIEGYIVDDSVALAIASAYQSPDNVGNVLAQLASTRRADYYALLGDIDKTDKEFVNGPTPWPRERQELDALRVWAMIK